MTAFADSLAQVRQGMEKAMGEFPALDRSRPPQMRVIDERTVAGVTYRRLDYLVEADDWVPAWLLLPPGSARRPAMLALHQTTKFGKDEPAGLAGKPNLHYAKELAERGFVVLVPDYPSLGDNKSDPYKLGYASTSMKAIVNHVRGLDLLASLPTVDPKRMGAIGHSLGGHNSLFLAIFDPRVKVVVTSCGFTAAHRYKGGDLTGWNGWRYMPRIGTIYHNSPAEVPFDFPDLVAALSNRGLFVNAPLNDDNFDVEGVRECMRRAGKTAIAVYPAAGHDFPPAEREQAYRYVERILRH
ncbi:MAG: alpha/beta fold hydrolase [Acidobacteria bacterium]|nr:alpha/beta fold hydrolase [Acidobacteriota bacterium]